MNRTAALCIVSALAVAYAITPRVFVLDDAYISLHSARVLLDGQDPIYGSEPFVGATSPPYVVLLAFFLALRLPALHVMAALGLVAFGAGLWTLGRTLRLSVPYTIVFIALCLACGYTIPNALNGIETGWAFAAVTWLIVFVLRDVPIGIACTAGLLPAIRPDLGPTAAIVFLYVLWNRSWAERARLVAIAAAVALPWFVLVRLDTGSWLPQTMRAKQYWFAETCWPIAKRLSTGTVHIRHVLWQLLPLSLSMLLLLKHRFGRVGLLAVLLTWAIYIRMGPGTLNYNYYRYLYAIVLPWACFGLAFLLSQKTISPPMRNVVIAFSLLFVLFTQELMSRRQADNADAQELVDVAAFVEANVSADAVVLIHDAGVISEFANRRLVDMVGLKTPSSIQAHARWTFPSCGRDRREAIAAIARNAGASYLVVVARWDNLYSIARGLQSSGFTLTRLRYPKHLPGFFVYQLSDRNPARTAN